MTPFQGTNRITSPYGWRTYKNSAGVTIREHHIGIDVVPTRYTGEEDLAGTAAGHKLCGCSGAFLRRSVLG